MKAKSVPWKLKDITPYKEHISKPKQCNKDIVFITFGEFTNTNKSYLGGSHG